MLSNDEKSRILFLWLDCNEFHAVSAGLRGVNVANVYRNTPRLLKALRRAHVKLNIFSIYPWLSSWANRLDSYDVVIIHASKLTPPVVEFIKRVSPGVRVIVWYWNPIGKSEQIESFISKQCEVWTFDEEDARTYGIRHNTQYYFKGLELKEQNLSNDVLFVGGDKGRLPFLLDIKDKLESLKLSTDFHIVGALSIKKKRYVYKERISYSEVIEKISRSKAILDVVSDRQAGLTLRPLEALFLRKKLITNDKTILNRDFYTKENIFLLGHDCISELPVFLDKPFCHTSRILDKYDFDNWLARFFLP